MCIYIYTSLNVIKHHPATAIYYMEYIEFVGRSQREDYFKPLFASS